jgi:hypothetical protein
MDPAVEEFRENIVVCVELLQVIIPELQCRNVASRRLPRPVPCFDRSDKSDTLLPDEH